MKTLSWTLIAILFVSFTFSGCQKAEKGDPGEDGNANVKSYSFTPITSDWSQLGIIDNPGFGYMALFHIPEITQDILDNGAVIGYMRSSLDGNVWFQLPYTITYEGYQSYFELAFQVGYASVSAYDSDLRTLIPSNHTYRFIVIEGNTGKRGLLDDVNTADYEATMRALGLQP